MAKVNGGVDVVLNLIVMKATIQMIVSLDMDSLHGQVATYIKVSTKMMKEMVMVKCTGLMAVATKVIGSKESSMGMAV